MAKMIPGRGSRESDPRSKESEIYHALTKLNDEYTVVHSLRLLNLSADGLSEHESDFVIFHEKLGFLCIEAKAGQVSYRDGDWLYASGLRMSHGGPFNQASNVKHRLLDHLHEKGFGDVMKRCKMHHAVWFPSVKKESLKSVNLPPEARSELILFMDDLADPSDRISEIMQLPIHNIEMNITSSEARRMVNEVLCPEFDLVPSRGLRHDLAELRFIEMLESQKRVLDFMGDQRSAVINGVAGSGKTLIALEHARRLAEQGDSVLFLCFNSLLKTHLEQECKGIDGIDVYSIAGYACKECNTPSPDYAKLSEQLEFYYTAENYKYKHVVVDEGQDFAVDAIKQADVLEVLDLLTEQNNGTFYLFYDKNQLVQGSGMPSFIERADCKLTLYVNCRNTKNISECSAKSLIKPAKYSLMESSVAGTLPRVHVATDPDQQSAIVDQTIEDYRSSGYEDIVILTCGTEESSVLSDYALNGKWKKSSIPFYSCRRFKGLEADAVILVDVGKELWVNVGDHPTSQGLLFYTGASRAKHELSIICDMDESECIQVLEAFGINARRRPYRELSKRLNSVLAG